MPYDFSFLPYDFSFSAPYPYLLEAIRFCFHLSSVFQLLTSKIGTMKKNQNIGKKTADNSHPTSSKNKYCLKFIDSWCNKFKFIKESRKGEGFALCTVCGSNFSVAYGGENGINRHKDTSKHKGHVDASQRQRKLTDASSATASFDQKVVKAELLFSVFFGWTQPPFEYCRSRC